MLTKARAPPGLTYRRCPTPNSCTGRQAGTAAADIKEASVLKQTADSRWRRGAGYWGGGTGEKGVEGSARRWPVHAAA